MATSTRVIIIDNGGSSIKAGFAGDHAPCVEIPTVFAEPPISGPKALRGADAFACNDGWALSSPIDRGVVKNWVQMEELWQLVFDKLQVSPAEHALLITETMFGSKVNRQMMASVLFESFNVPSLHVALSGTCALYAAGCCTAGLVIELGDGVSQMAPIFENYLLKGVSTQRLAGSDVTEHLRASLEDKVTPSNALHIRDVRRMKEQLCYVAQDYKAELRVASAQEFLLPDGTKLAVGPELLTCPEMFFDPSLAGSEADGIHKMAQKSIAACGADLSRSLAGNIVLSGGSAAFRGLESRMREELRSLLPAGTNIKVSTLEEPQFGTFRGGSTLAMSAKAQESFISRAKWEEDGVDVLAQFGLCMTECQIRDT